MYKQKVLTSLGKDPHTNTTSTAHSNDSEKTTVDENRRSTNRTELSKSTPKTKEATGSKEAEPAPPGLKRSSKLDWASMRLGQNVFLTMKEH